MRVMSLPTFALALTALSGDKPSRSNDYVASRAAPEIIMFYGGPLPSPIVVASWTENHALLLTGEPREPMIPGRSTTLPRTTIKLALFWGIQWRAYAGSPSFLATLTPVSANQQGEFLPAVPGARARIRIGSVDGPVSDSGLAVLRRHRIPTRVE